MTSPRSRDYIIEKLTVALDCLAASDDSLKSRLLNAYLSSFIRLMDTDFADSSELEKFQLITEFFRRVPDEKRGSAAASVEVASIDDCKAVAESIVWLMFKVASRA